MPFSYGEVELGQTSLSPIRTSIPRTVRNTNRGKLIWFDSFEEPSAATRWRTISTGLGNTAERSMNRSYDGNVSWHQKLITSSVRSVRSFYHYADRISAEAFFSFNNDMRVPNDGQAAFLEIHYFDGAYEQIFRVEYRPALRQWLYWSYGTSAQPALIDNDADPIAAGQPVIYRLAAYDDSGTTNLQETWHQVRLYVDRTIPSYLGMERDGNFRELTGYPTSGVGRVPFHFLTNVNQPPLTGSVVPTYSAQQKHWTVALVIVRDTLAFTGHCYWDAVSVFDETGFVTPSGY